MYNFNRGRIMECTIDNKEKKKLGLNKEIFLKAIKMSNENQIKIDNKSTFKATLNRDGEQLEIYLAGYFLGCVKIKDLSTEIIREISMTDEA